MSDITIKIADIEIGRKPFIIAGPCVIESRPLSLEIAGKLKEFAEKYSINIIFKASFDKANRSSIDSYRGPGLERGMEILEEIKRKTSLPVTTDIHLPNQAKPVSLVVDLIQIPAFLSRQTDLIVAAAQTGIPLNIKKAQFMSPKDMSSVIKKAESTGNKKIILTERGSCFGYNNLIIDPRSIPIMRQYGYPVILDVTHSLQQPSVHHSYSGGTPEFIPDIARLGAALNCDGLFFEVHPNPGKALSDAKTMLQIDKLPKIILSAKAIWKAVRSENN